MTFTEIVLSMVSEGIFPGILSVLSFVPSIMILTFLLSLLREIGIIRGYAALYLTGFSCSVPAMLACETIHDKRLRYLTIFLLPYMSCSAKLPIYILLSSVFFPAFPIAVICSIYLLGIIIVLTANLTSKMSGQTALSCISAPIKPKFQSLSLKKIFRNVKRSCLGFIKKAFTVIPAASGIIWLLQNFDPSLAHVSNIEESMLAQLGNFFVPVFSPLGFGDWRASAALITGISSKESVVSTFAVMAGSPEGQALCAMLNDIFTPASALSFMAFCLLYIPCIGTIAAMQSSAGNSRAVIVILLAQTAFAWSVSFLIFHSIKVII